MTVGPHCDLQHGPQIAGRASLPDAGRELDLEDLAEVSAINHRLWSGWMKQDIDTALALLTEAFPQTFVLEKYRPHRPLKVGIAADIPATVRPLSGGC